MRGRLGVRVAVLGLAAVLATAGCSGGDDKAVTFQPADGSVSSSAGAAAAPTATATVPATAPPVSAPPNGSVTDPASGVVISRNGSTVCVRSRNGSQACSSGGGVVVMDGVTVSNGVVVSGGGAGGAVVSTVTPTPTSGKVTLSGAVTWSGTATGTCQGRGTGVRAITANLPDVGRLVMRNVGDGVLNLQVEANGTRYSVQWVGQGGPVSSSTDRTRIDGARLGRGGNVLVVSGDFDC